MESYTYLFLFVLQLVFTVVVLLALLHEKRLQKQLEKKNKQLLTELLNLRGEIQAMRSTYLTFTGKIVRISVSTTTASEELKKLISATEKLKKELERIKLLTDALKDAKAAGEKIMGYDLESGRLRDIAAKILGKKPTQIANAMSINSNLIPELRKLLEKQKISFSVAVEIAGLEEDEQEEIYSWYPDEIITVKKIREYKQRILEEQREAELKESRQEAEEEETEIEGQMELEKDFPEYCPEPDEIQRQAIEAFAEYMQSDIRSAGINNLSELKEYMKIHYRNSGGTLRGSNGFDGWYDCGKGFITLSIDNGDDDPFHEVVKKTIVKMADAICELIKFDTEEQKEERVEIPQTNKVEVQETRSDERRHRLKIAKMFFDVVDAGKKSFELQKNDRNYQIGDILEMHEMDNGEETGRITEKKVIYVLEGFKGLEKGYCILGLKEVEEV